MWVDGARGGGLTGDVWIAPEDWRRARARAWVGGLWGIGAHGHAALQEEGEQAEQAGQDHLQGQQQGGAKGQEAGPGGLKVVSVFSIFLQLALEVWARARQSVSLRLEGSHAFPGRFSVRVHPKKMSLCILCIPNPSSLEHTVSQSCVPCLPPYPSLSVLSHFQQ